MGVLNAVGLWLGLARGMAGQALGLPSPWEHSIRAFEARDRRRAPGPGVHRLRRQFELHALVVAGSRHGAAAGRQPGLRRGADRRRGPLRGSHRGAVPALGRRALRRHQRHRGARPASADYVAERFDAFVAKVRLAVPEALIFYVAITPSRARWSLWPVAMEANRLIEARVRADARLRFIDLGRFLLGRDGTPDPEFYRRDGLHPSKSGYRIWAREIAAALHHETALMEKLGVPD